MSQNKQNGADRVTKEKDLKSQKEVEEEMLKKRKAQVQAISSGVVLVIALVVVVGVFLMPFKQVLKLNVTVFQKETTSLPELANAQFTFVKNPLMTVFDSNPSGNYGLVLNLNSSNQKIYREFINIGTGKVSLDVSEDVMPKGDWSFNLSIYIYLSDRNVWNNTANVNGVFNVR